jgi:hypothetical protein
VVQQVMSGESTPILCGAIYAFEIFMTRWEMNAADHPRLKPMIQAGLEWAYKYYRRMDSTKAYVVSMCTSNFILNAAKINFYSQF